jgi:hypothetical protein
VIHDDGHRELARRIHSGIDPILPAPGVEQRALDAARERMRARPAWLRPFQTTLGSALVAAAVIALVGGALGLTLALRGQSAPVAPALTPVVPVIPAIHPPSVTATPAPSPTSSTPGAIAYVQPDSISFSNASDGWTLGNACDQHERCEIDVARTTDGGAKWSLVTSPVGAFGDSYTLAVTASSSTDAWVWGLDANGLPELVATHDGGETWQPAIVAGTTVVDVVVADGTAWAETGCQQVTATCSAHLLSQSEHGGAWTDLGKLPAAIQGATQGLGSESSPPLARADGRAWVLNAYPQEPALLRTDNGARSWTTLPLPCPFGTTATLGASSTENVMLACASVGSWPAAQEIWTSSDGGSHWDLRSRNWYSGSRIGNINDYGAPFALAVLNNGTVWMANDRDDDLVTHDDGVNWSRASLPIDYFGGGAGAEGVTFTDPQHGWTFTSAGLWVTTDGGAVWKRQSIIGPVLGY